MTVYRKSVGCPGFNRLCWPLLKWGKHSHLNERLKTHMFRLLPLYLQSLLPMCFLNSPPSLATIFGTVTLAFLARKWGILWSIFTLASNFLWEMRKHTAVYVMYKYLYIYKRAMFIWTCIHKHIYLHICLDLCVHIKKTYTQF